MNDGMNHTDKERVQAANIRRQYINRDHDKMEQLRRLDNKVKIPGKIVASLMGIAGALVMGGGMSLIMVWGNMRNGLSLGVPGMIVALLAYPIYTFITGKNVKRNMLKKFLNLARR